MLILKKQSIFALNKEKLAEVGFEPTTITGHEPDEHQAPPSQFFFYIIYINYDDWYVNWFRMKCTSSVIYVSYILNKKLLFIN